jgi:tryptophan 2,3-dioxygenase
MHTESRTPSAASCPHMMRLRSSLQCPITRSVPVDEALPLPLPLHLRPADAIATWLSSLHAGDFPYDAVVAEFHRVGKHFVATELLEALAAARAALPRARGSVASVRLLERFLDAALDKWDGRYANPTYLGLSLLPLPAVDEFNDDIGAVQRRYDRLFVQLIADAMRFELAAADGATELLPQMRADARTTAKRCRLSLQIAGPAARRQGLAEGVDAALKDPVAGARRLYANLAADLSPAERRVLQLTMLPVSLVHDEYQFIRVLQSYEATFALVAVQLHTAVRALSDGESALAQQSILAAERALHEAAPLWSLVATMRVEAFQTFREFTEGASAIQSRNYKLIESLCRRPDPDRLDSAAYHSVPEVRQRVLAGQLTLDEAFQAARDAGHFSSGEVEDLEQAMREIAATLLRWRRTHVRIAVRFLGERTGTSYTEGAPYLQAVQAIPVFSSVAMSEAAEDAEAREVESGELAAVRTRDVSAARGRCPFAA